MNDALTHTHARQKIRQAWWGTLRENRTHNRDNRTLRFASTTFPCLLAIAAVSILAQPLVSCF